DLLRPRSSSGAHRVRAPPQLVALVGVSAAQQDQHVALADAQRANGAPVALRGGWQEARQIGHRELLDVAFRGLADHVRSWSPTRTQDDGDVESRKTSLLQQRRGSLLRELVGGLPGIRRRGRGLRIVARHGPRLPRSHAPQGWAYRMGCYAA